MLIYRHVVSSFSSCVLGNLIRGWLIQMQCVYGNIQSKVVLCIICYWILPVFKAT